MRVEIKKIIENVLRNYYETKQCRLKVTHARIIADLQLTLSAIIG